ncbi:hypothetical protein E2C01_012983 [Portunus trituberculatus]|uniref:Uncharacterized protein n=1 Tax=Portunus trituberculatus TaxID=210409 RepID=A0A5B7DFM4_PORTR|nr:hypothetical protein [Portunus trituberculatus]
MVPRVSERAVARVPAGQDRQIHYLAMGGGGGSAIVVQCVFCSVGRPKVSFGNTSHRCRVVQGVSLPIAGVANHRCEWRAAAPQHHSRPSRRGVED